MVGHPVEQLARAGDGRRGMPAEQPDLVSGASRFLGGVAQSTVGTGDASRTAI
jgi:hypothetical protein